MKIAITQIKQLIQYHQNERDKQLAFYDTKEYKSQMHPEADTEFIKKHTAFIYNELIDELNKAISILEQHGELNEETI
ncbi:hypothetical protein ACIGIJ_18565 [Bacillus paranthracis]|uniref:hypothetical protein n=1 Tax=Bacillus paranthracis TaxID=2026186 RepID=UPI0037C672A7